MSKKLPDTSKKVLKDLYKKAQKEVSDFSVNSQPKTSGDLTKFLDKVHDKQAEANAEVIITFVETEILPNIPTVQDSLRASTKSLTGITVSESSTDYSGEIEELQNSLTELEDNLQILQEEVDSLVLSGGFVAENISYDNTTSELDADNVQEAIDELATDLLPENLLEAIKLVDGSGSGLNADLLDGMSASDFASASHTHSFSSITGKPTTLAGYGIVDAVSSSDFTELENIVTDISSAYVLTSQSFALISSSYLDISGAYLLTSQSFTEISNSFLDLQTKIIDENAKVYNVGQNAGMFQTVQEAVDAINNDSPTATNRSVILVWPGKYTTTASITIPSWTGVKGVSKGLVQFQNDVTSIFTCSSNTWFEDFLVEGSSTEDIYAFEGNNANAIHIRRVDMLNNGGSARQKFLLQEGTTWSILFLEDCIIDYYGTSGYSVTLRNTDGSARFVDTIINNVFFDAYQLTGFGGSFRIFGCQDVRIRNSTIRGEATWNTGVRVNLGSVTGTPEVDIRHSFLEGGVPVYGELGTHYNLINCYAPNALSDGTRTVKHSNDSVVADGDFTALSSSFIDISGAYVLTSRSFGLVSSSYLLLSRSHVDISGAYFLTSQSFTAISTSYLNLSSAYQVHNHNLLYPSLAVFNLLSGNFSDVSGAYVLTSQSFTQISNSYLALSSAYQAHNHDSRYVELDGDTMTGLLRTVGLYNSSGYFEIGSYNDSYGVGKFQSYYDADDKTLVMQARDASNNVTPLTMSINGGIVWHAGNDGVGSGLHADLLDGQHGSYYRDISNATGIIEDGQLVDRLTKQGKSILGDWSDHEDNGWYYNFGLATDGPSSKPIGSSGSNWNVWAGTVVRGHQSSVQTIINTVSSSETDTMTWQRRKTPDGWQDWYRLLSSETELKRIFATTSSVQDLLTISSSFPVVSSAFVDLSSAFNSRTIATSTPLMGGGNLSTNRTLTIASASISTRGTMSISDFVKLQGIEDGATTDMSASEILDHLKTVDGAGSGLDADTVDGYHADESSTVSTVAVRNSSGDIAARLFRSEYDTTNSNIQFIMTQIDTNTNNYIRPSTIAQVLSSLSITSGTYTPTMFAGTNVSSPGAGICMYFQIGTMVVIFGAIALFNITAAGNWQFDMSLPSGLGSDFTQTTQAGGTFGSSDTDFAKGLIQSNATNNRLSFQGRNNTAGGAGNAWFIVGYQIL